MKRLKTLAQIIEELTALKSGWSGDSILTTKVVVFIAEQMTQMNGTLAKLATQMKARDQAMARWLKEQRVLIVSPDAQLGLLELQPHDGSVAAEHDPRL